MNKEIATKILKAIDLHQLSYIEPSLGDRGYYKKSLEECFDEVFEEDPMREIYFWSTMFSWNSTIDVCRGILGKNTSNDEGM